MKEEKDKHAHRALLMREEVYASRHSLSDIQNRLRLAGPADDGAGAYGVDGRRALPGAAPPPPIEARSKREYISLARAELQSIREDARAKLIGAAE